MSEPLSNHEIEDVVSSIRRLVSTEPRSRTRDLGIDKLLLTPALRVVPDVPPEPLVLASAVQAPQAPAAEAVVAEVHPPAVEEEGAAAPDAVMTEVPATVSQPAQDPVSEPVAALDSGPFAVAETGAEASAGPDVQTGAAPGSEPDSGPDSGPDSAPDSGPASEPDDQTIAAIRAALVEPETAESVTGQDAATQSQAGAQQAANLAGSPVRASATLHLIDAEWEDEIWEEPEPTLAELAEGVEDAELVSDAADGMTDARLSAGLHYHEQPVPFFAHPRSRAPAEVGPVSDGGAEEPVAAAHAIAEPVVAEAVRAEPASAEPVSAERAIPDPMIAAPVTSEPVTSEPVISEQVIAEPVIAEPVIAEAVIGEPVIGEPGIAEPVIGEPGIAEPASVGLAVAPSEPLADSSADDPASGSDEMALAIQAEEAEGTDLEPGYAMVDEDVLNEIVRDLIREELQGALGERITRNVRKLVRAEINRALASRPYE